VTDIFCNISLQIAEKHGLAHTSKGIGEDRFIVVTKPGISMLAESDIQSDEKEDAVRNTVEMDNRLVDEIIDENMSKRNKKKKKKHKENIEENVKDSINNSGNGELLDASLKNSNNNCGNKKLVDESLNNGDISAKDFNEAKEFIGAPISDGKIVCGICKKDVLKANLQLHEIHCARKEKDMRMKRDEVEVKDKQKKGVSKSTKHRKFDKELAERVEKVDKDDIDALIATVQNMDNFCCFKKCKTSVQTLFQVCSHCQGRYCMSHHIPEVHGCGEAARAQARARINKDGVLYRGSGVPEKRPDATKKAHLQRKLDSKLTELSAKRKGKPKK
jgi:hypothetical protein